jgi:hypothetical protein
MFQIFDTVKFYICFICYNVFHILLSWDRLWTHGMYICNYEAIHADNLNTFITKYIIYYKTHQENKINVHIKIVLQYFQISLGYMRSF